jgi:uncharacterized membrane protein YhaH (DUF805 family)
VEIWPIISKVFRSYTDYKGRTGRREYWVWWVAVLAVLALFSEPYAVWRSFEPDSAAVPGGFVLASISLGVIAFLVTLPARIAICVRRLHDSDLASGYLLFWLVPVVGGLWPLVLGFFPGTKTANRFGEPIQA